MRYVMLLGVALAVSYRIITPDERARSRRAVSRMKQWLMQAITLRHPELEPFHDMLHVRTPVALVTPTLLVLNITIFVLMLWSADPLSDSDTLAGWGGNVGPRTVNGEWWRIFTALFVHASWLHLLANVVGLLQLGLMLERLVGPMAFAALYLVAGLFSSVIQLSAAPVAISVGASGAIFGAYGLTLAVLMWGVLHRSSSIVPMAAAKSLAPAAAAFVLYSFATDAVSSVAELSGCITGFACGMAKPTCAARGARTRCVRLPMRSASSAPSNVGDSRSSRFSLMKVPFDEPRSVTTGPSGPTTIFRCLPETCGSATTQPQSRPEALLSGRLFSPGLLDRLQAPLTRYSE